MNNIKTCGKCKRTKESVAFHNDRASKDGKHYYCKICSNKQSRTANRKVYLKIRNKIIEKYSNGTPKCNCCGEREFKFLVIDHRFNDGNLERKSGIKGLSLWKKIVKENYPKTYQILCYNCNMAKAFHDQCPHKLEQLKKLL